jgi:predicted DNA-binding protein YlxM (UPF0122 family)
LYKDKRWWNSKLTFNDEKDVIDLYVNQKKSLSSIGEKFNVNLVTIKNVLKRNSIETRKPGNSFKFFDNETVEKIIELYKSGESQEKISKLLKTSQAKVSRALGLNGIDCGRKRGKNNKNWKGGRFVRNNYIYVIMPNDSPYKKMALSNGYVAEHRYNMAVSIGRCLEKTETVHHINGDTFNNEIKNLQLRQGKHGKHQVFVCCDCGSKNIKPTEL